MPSARASLRHVRGLRLMADSTHSDGSSEISDEPYGTTSADLAKRVLAGDIDAFEPLYRAQSSVVYALCLRMSGDTTRATELTQSVFVRAWERLGSFRGDSSFGTWLHRLAVNVVLENLRSDNRRSARVVTDADSLKLPDAAIADSPDERLDIDAAISRLPPGARVAFVLHEIEGYSHQEISTLTGLATGTVRAQVFRARQLLIKALS